MSSKKQATDTLIPSGDNVEQIREILFGGHIRAFDERFDLVEARLAKESSTLQRKLEKRLAELERILGDYRDEASDRLGSESSNRDLALNKLELALASARMDAENRMAQLHDNMSTEFSTLRAELAAEQKESAAALDRVEKTQNMRSDKLDEDKIDRKQLSELLNDIAERIHSPNGERT